MKRMIPMALFLVTILMVTRCSRLFPKGSPEMRPVPLAQVPDEIVKLERSFSADGEAVNMGYDHPHEFSEQAMRDEFERLRPLMKCGGFIPSVDHQTPPEVSMSQYRQYLRLLWEYTEVE